VTVSTVLLAEPVAPAEYDEIVPVAPLRPPEPFVDFSSQTAPLVMDSILQDTVTGVFPVVSTRANRDGPAVTVMGDEKHCVLFFEPLAQSSA
jgi:hypothetical protein